MSIPAPQARLVDALSGAKAPAKFFKAMEDADAICADLDEVCELRTRVDELAAENSDLIEQLRELDECHQITLGLLAAANAQLKRMQATR